MGHLARGLPPLGQKDGQQSSVAHQYEVQARGLEQSVQHLSRWGQVGQVITKGREAASRAPPPLTQRL